MKTCVITGPTAGIGRETARALAKDGWRLVLVCRDRTKGEALVTELGGGHEIVIGDMGSLASIRSAAAAVLERCPRIDALVNNAGAIFSSRKLTADGFEA